MKSVVVSSKVTITRSSKGETNTKRPQSEWADRGSMHEIRNKKPEETREVVRSSDKMSEAYPFINTWYVEAEDHLDAQADMYAHCTL